jgi:hypothetical protein
MVRTAARLRRASVVDDLSLPVYFKWSEVGVSRHIGTGGSPASAGADTGRSQFAPDRGKAQRGRSRRAVTRHRPATDTALRPIGAALAGLSDVQLRACFGIAYSLAACQLVGVRLRQVDSPVWSLPDVRSGSSRVNHAPVLSGGSTIHTCRPRLDGSNVPISGRSGLHGGRRRPARTANRLSHRKQPLGVG